MRLYRKKRISVIVEGVYCDDVIQLLADSGASGYTVYTELYGKGEHGIRTDRGSLGDVTGNFEVVCIAGPEVTERVLQGLTQMIGNGVIMIVHVIDTEVLRDDHFA